MLLCITISPEEIPPVFEIFSDRMEFTSYGGLISGQSKEDFFSCSSMRAKQRANEGF